jgi:hypothetical protein
MKFHNRICKHEFYENIDVFCAGIFERKITRSIQKDLRVVSRLNGSEERRLGILKMKFKYICVYITV